MSKPLVDRSDREPPDLDALRAAVNVTPDDVVARRRLGWALYGSGAFSEAHLAFTEAAASFPNDEPIRFGLALAEKRLGKGEEAAQIFSGIAAEAEVLDDPARSEILTRLATGHANFIRTGRWGLKRAIWGGA